MKTKKFFLQTCLFCLLMAGSINASAYESKFEQSTGAFGNGANSSNGITPGTDDPNDTQPPIAADPVGEGVEILAVLGIAYSLYLIKRRKSYHPYATFIRRTN